MIDFWNSNKTVIIAELSCNHIQHYDIAVKTIEAMAACGVDVVKVQNDNADGGITINCDNEYFQVKGGTLWDGETLYTLYKKTDTPWDWLPKLQKLAHSLGMGFFSTPSDPTGVDFLEKLDVPVYKIASFEITDVGLIEKVAKTGKPIIISTGIAEEEDIQLAVDTCRKVGNNNILLMKCTSSYPAPIEDANLLTIPDMRKRFAFRSDDLYQQIIVDEPFFKGVIILSSLRLMLLENGVSHLANRLKKSALAHHRAAV